MKRCDSILDSLKSISEITVKGVGNRKLKVAAYCRVSTDDSEQINSLNLQKAYYESLIKESPKWIFAGIYADVASETQIKGREAFQQMLKDCAKRKIDLILTKSVYRFSRNTLDSLKTVHMLKDKGIGIYFEREGINTLSAQSEFILTVMSAFAQSESESKSKDIRWGLERTFNNPASKYYQRVCYGYTHDENGKLVIDEEKATIVCMIYKWHISGSKKGHSLLCEPAQVIYRFIYEHTEYTVARWAAFFQVSRSGYYAFIERRERREGQEKNMRA